MTYVPNLFSFPILILIWLIELYLFLASARLVMTVISSARQSHFYQQLKLLTDFIPDALQRKLAGRNNKSIPWLPWFLVMTIGFVTRQALIVIITN